MGQVKKGRGPPKTPLHLWPAGVGTQFFSTRSGPGAQQRAFASRCHQHRPGQKLGAASLSPHVLWGCVAWVSLWGHMHGAGCGDVYGLKECTPPERTEYRTRSPAGRPRGSRALFAERWLTCCSAEFSEVLCQAPGSQQGFRTWPCWLLCCFVTRREPVLCSPVTPSSRPPAPPVSLGLATAPFLVNRGVEGGSRGFNCAVWALGGGVGSEMRGQQAGHGGETPLGPGRFSGSVSPRADCSPAAPAANPGRPQPVSSGSSLHV